jgi:hypothetical protein
MVLKSSERHELCGTALTHHREKLGIVLSLECSVIMTNKDRVHRAGRPAIATVSILYHLSFISVFDLSKKGGGDSDSITEYTTPTLVL